MIVGITGQYVGDVLELVSHDAVDAQKLLNGVTLIVAIDILGTNLKLMPLAQRSKPVNLEGVLLESFLVRHHLTRIGKGCIQHF